MSHKATGKVIGSLILGVAIGSVVGYFLGTDEEQREEQLNTLKEKAQKSYDEVRSKLREQFGKEHPDLQDEIYNS